MKELLKATLKPLYQALLPKVTSKNKVYTFCLQWGNNFPKEVNTGILYVGKATNGWVTNTRDVDILFGDTKERVFARYDQMAWVHNLEKDKKYNTLNSAFWRVIKKICQSVYGSEGWYSHVAWSNLYKVSFEKGNPDAKLKKEQLELCKKVLQEEIRILSPKYVVFLTSGWEKSFFDHLTKGLTRENLPVVKWGGKHETRAFKVGKTILICSAHPQGKNEYEHAMAIVGMMKD